MKKLKVKEDKINISYSRLRICYEVGEETNNKYFFKRKKLSIFLCERIYYSFFML